MSHHDTNLQLRESEYLRHILGQMICFELFYHSEQNYDQILEIFQLCLCHL